MDKTIGRIHHTFRFTLEGAASDASLIGDACYLSGQRL